MIDAGIIPMPLWEADCTKRLEVIRDIPPGKCIYWFERTDMVKALSRCWATWWRCAATSRPRC